MINIRRSLSIKLSIGILLMTVPVFVLSVGLLYRQSRNFVLKEALEHANSTLDNRMQRVRNYMTIVETATNANDWIVVENFHPDTLLAVSNRIVRLNRHVNGCSITAEPDMFSQYGRYFSAYTIRQGDSIVTVREGEYEYFDKVWYKTPRELGKPCWVEPFDDFNEGTLYTPELIVSYCKPLRQNGQFIGVISTDLSLRQLADVITSDPPYPNSYFIMIGRGGHYFIHPDTTKLFQKTIFTDVDPTSQSDIIALGHEMTEGKQGNMNIDINGTTSLVCYQPIPQTEWSLALVCPDKDILGAYHQLTYIVIPLIAIGLLVIIMLCSNAVAHTIRPINQLLNKTQSIAEGNYEVYIPKSPREDVIGRLQNSFAKMLQYLNFNMGSARYAAEQMERQNKELAKAMHLVEEADRQKIKFVQNVTHQIRTPLNIIMGFAQVWSENLGQLPEEEMKSIVSQMDHNAKSLNRMVLMLVDSSETGSALALAIGKNQEPIACNVIAREAIGYTNEHFPDLPIQFRTTLPDTFTIRTNHLYLMRSLRELLYNAAKYSDRQHVSVRLEQSGNNVRFIVEDTGPGISEEYREVMYDIFTKVDDLSEGLGLGLPLAKRHISNLGGEFIFDTDYHDGCRFIIELPTQNN